MAEIILEPTVQSKVIPLSVRLNDTDTSLVSQFVTNRQFNTADTDAWFSFTLEGLAATTGTFDLTLINLNDKSVFNHTDKVFNTNPFYYKLDSGADELTNEIRHAGKWVGQLVVTLANGDSATRKFIFGIEGHILDGTVVQTILLEDYNALINSIESAKDELTQYNIDYDSLIGTVTDQEAARLEAEELRVIADALRETKEGIRQATFEANEVIRDGVVDSAIEGEMISQTVATKLAEKEATYAPRLVSVEQQLAEIHINVKTFGAKGDGIADDTLAVQEAFDYAFANNVNIYIPDGNYNVSHIRATAQKKISITVTGSGSLLLNDSNELTGIILSGTPESKIALSGITIKGEDTYLITFPLRLRKWNTAIADGVTVDTFHHNGITAGDCHLIKIVNCTILNCGDLIGERDSTSVDYINDGVYIHNADIGIFDNNYIVNDVSENTPYHYGRVGITCQYDVKLSTAKNNFISGYSRGIHYEMNQQNQNAVIENNRLIGNCTGILIWNNKTGILSIENNFINNKGAIKSKSKVNKWSVDATGQYGYAILIFGNTADLKCVIRKNICRGIYDTSLILQRGLYMTSGQSVTLENNKTIYKNKEYFVIEDNFFDCGLSDVKELTETNIPDLSATHENLYFLNSTVRRNVFNGMGQFNLYLGSTFEDTRVEENIFTAHGKTGAFTVRGITSLETNILPDFPTTRRNITVKHNTFISKTSANQGLSLELPKNNEVLDFSDNSILLYGVSALKQPAFSGGVSLVVTKSMQGNVIFDNNELEVIGNYSTHPSSWVHTVGYSVERPNTIISLDQTFQEISRRKMFGYNKKYNKKYVPTRNSPYTYGYFYQHDFIITYDGNIGNCLTDGYYTQKTWSASTNMTTSINNNNPLVFSNNRCFLCKTNGTTGATVPAAFSTAAVGDLITDGTVTWEYVGELGTFNWNK